METASVVRRSGQTQNALFGNLVLHTFTPDAQSKKERLETRTEIDNLSARYPVRVVNHHNDPILDVLDVIEYLGDASRALKPSADPAYKKGSLKECLDFLCSARAEVDDAIDVVCKALENVGENWREMPCMQDTPKPIYTELT